MATLYFMYHMLENYGIDSEVTYLVDNRELYFMPVINPDGYVYNETISPDGGGMWYKNRRGNSSYVFGVSINQNYGYKWGYDELGSSSQLNSEAYRGQQPFSEPETEAVKKFCIDHDFKISVNYHTTRGIYYWRTIWVPWAYTNTQCPDSNQFNSLVSLATSLNSYSNGILNPKWTEYTSNGDVCDWMYGATSEKNKIFAVLPEIGEKNGTVWPSPEKMMIDCQENLYMNMVYAWGPGIIEDPPFIKNVNEIKKYLEPGKDSVYIKLLSVNPKNYQSNVYATFVADDIDTVGQIELDLGESENSFEGVWNSINSEERFYEIILHQNGINIPSTFYYKDKNQLSFTTTGPIKVESYEIEISPAGRISLTNFTLKNYGKTKKVENIKAELTTKNSNLTRYSTKIISFGDILPGNSKTGVSSFSFYTEAGTNSIEFILAIKSNDVNFWTDT